MNFLVCNRRPIAVLASLVLASMCGAAARAADAPAWQAPAVVAQAVDATLETELPAKTGPAAIAVTDDETFLRRASQDLIGELPTPEEITAFVFDTAADKRARAVDRLLADPRYGQNWGRYFRDVILFRRTDDRVLPMGPSIVAFLTEQFNQGAGWDKIAHAFITAEGDVRENGNTGLIMAQMGQPAEIAAETARIFLGIQIQCAQCHDHKTDRWKRKQFHELAAFFPRVVVRPVRDGDKRVSFAVVSRDTMPRRLPKNLKPQGDVEHYMPDLNDASAKGTLTTPIFFLTGQTTPLGTKDKERREALASWITAKENPWFARAFVHRLWAELVGQGFYEPIDDLGPERTATAPQTLDLLSQEFTRHDYDVKWLLRTIMATKAYQRATQSQHGDATPAAAGCPQPLRADQVFNALPRSYRLTNRRSGHAGGHRHSVRYADRGGNSTGRSGSTPALRVMRWRLRFRRPCC